MFGADGGTESLHEEYLAASLKKQAEQQVEAHIDVWEMDLQYGVRDRHGKVWVGYKDREDAEAHIDPGDIIVVRESVRACTEWRDA